MKQQYQQIIFSLPILYEDKGHFKLYPLFGLVWFGLFVQPFSHICNIGHVNYRLQFIYYNTTYNIWTSTQYNVINNNTKFEDQLEVDLSLHLDICVFI
jgi:hypothetical protein